MLACGLATAARINQGSSMSGASEAASCAQVRAACLSPRWRALVACFKAWLGRMGWLAMIISFPTNLLAFYFDWQQTRNSISMVNSGGYFLPRKRSFHQNPRLPCAPVRVKRKPSRTWLLVILIFIDIFTCINLLILLIKEPFDPAPTDGNGKPAPARPAISNWIKKLPEPGSR